MPAESTCLRSCRSSLADWWRRSGSFSMALSMTVARNAGRYGVERARRGVPPIQELIEHCRRCVALERRSPGRHLEEDDPQREQVRARIERFSERLFGRHVARRAERRPAAGLLPRHRDRLRVPRRCRRKDLRQSEVEDLDAIGVGHHDIAGLEVPVQDSGSVGRRKALGHLRREGQRPRNGQRSAGSRSSRRLRP